MGGSFGGSNLAGSKTTPLYHAKALSETLGGGHVSFFPSWASAACAVEVFFLQKIPSKKAVSFFKLFLLMLIQP